MGEDACDHIEYFNDEKAACLRQMIDAAPNVHVQIAYQTKLAFVLRRQFNPSVPGNKEPSATNTQQKSTLERSFDI